MDTRRCENGNEMMDKTQCTEQAVTNKSAMMPTAKIATQPRLARPLAVKM